VLRIVRIVAGEVEEQAGIFVAAGEVEELPGIFVAAEVEGLAGILVVVEELVQEQVQASSVVGG